MPSLSAGVSGLLRPGDVVSVMVTSKVTQFNQQLGLLAATEQTDTAPEAHGFPRLFLQYGLCQRAGVVLAQVILRVAQRRVAILCSQRFGEQAKVFCPVCPVRLQHAVRQPALVDAARQLPGKAEAGGKGEPQLALHLVQQVKGLGHRCYGYELFQHPRIFQHWANGIKPVYRADTRHDGQHDLPGMAQHGRQERVEAARTGHTVASTLHANSATQAYARMYCWTVPCSATRRGHGRRER